MAGKYEHLFVKDMANIDDDYVYEGEAAGIPVPENIIEGYALMRGADVPESKIHMSHCWVTETDRSQLWVEEHVHDYDEVLIWTGGDPYNSKDLGAEIYMTIEGEEHLITTSGSVYIPAGTRHCPLGFNWVKRPFRFSALALNPTYT